MILSPRLLAFCLVFETECLCVAWMASPGLGLQESTTCQTPCSGLIVGKGLALHLPNRRGFYIFKDNREKRWKERKLIKFLLSVGQ